MKVVEIRTEAEFYDLKPAWDELLCRSASANTFLSWEWARTWWSAYGEAGALRILAAYDEHGRLCGIAPLRLGRLARFGQEAPALSFIGDGSNDSDYLDFLIARGEEERVMSAFLAACREEMNRGTILMLNEVPTRSLNYPHLTTLGECGFSLRVESEEPCGLVHLPESWEGYLAMLRPRFRTKVRSVLHSLESGGKARFGFCESTERLEKLLPVLFDLHARRWATEGKPGVFRWDRKREFYRTISPLLLDRGWLRFCWLEWNDRVLACQYGFRFGDSYYQLQEGYEPAAEHLSAGIGLRAWSIREFIREGIRVYDFMGGLGRHKMDWGAQRADSRRIAIARGTPKNRLLLNGPQWTARMRERIGGALPEGMVRAIRARRKPAGTSAAAAGAWLKAGAGCYFHLRLGGLLRPLRDRYEIGRSGSACGISLARRSRAVARVLYYHRVNDDNDPFFPAISTRLFEAEMRYLAANYRVVGISDMLDRLQSESPEPVVAVTFDDGYRDNYLNAFPILRRYGLPATIFLTTSGLDSREPLWFERLADTMKRTDREFLDLEMDFPRRFWLRTPAERLRANAEIFALLRRIPDRERRETLAGILAQCGISGDGRWNLMLNWDEVRLLSRHWIEFGAHTVNHPFLSRLTREDAVWELSYSKGRIEAELQAACQCFAYPNGRREDFTEWNKAVLRESGYRAAMTTIWGVNDAATDPMELRRGGPWESSAAMFAAKLDWYQSSNS